MDAIKVKLSDVRSIVRATFPDYRGRKFTVDASGRVTFSDLHWDEERRETAEMCRRECKLARSRMNPDRRREYDRNMRQDRRRFER